MGPKELILFQNVSGPELPQSMTARYQVLALILEWAMQNFQRLPGHDCCRGVVKSRGPTSSPWQRRQKGRSSMLISDSHLPLPLTSSSLLLLCPPSPLPTPISFLSLSPLCLLITSTPRALESVQSRQWLYLLYAYPFKLPALCTTLPPNP